jgi:hypothetical protein
VTMQYGRTRPERRAGKAALWLAGMMVLAGLVGGPARADQAAPAAPEQPAPPAPAQTGWQDDLSAYFANWDSRVDAARASQPSWSSPLVTTTATLEERVRFDTSFQHAGNDTDTINLDGGKGVDLIVSDTQEIQVGTAPYVIRSAPTAKGDLTGFGDWPFVRFKQRLASAPAGAGNYVVSAWLQIQAPTGRGTLSNKSYTLLPTLGFGKGFGRFVIQGTVGATIPVAYESKTGSTVTSNVAFQYHVGDYLWPQIETNWNYYPDGLRAGKNQVFLTPGLVAGRFAVGGRLKLTFGVGYQVAVAPSYRPKPLLPSYDRAWIISTRLSF